MFSLLKIMPQLPMQTIQVLCMGLFKKLEVQLFNYPVGKNNDYQAIEIGVGPAGWRRGFLDRGFWCRMQHRPAR